MNPDQFISDWIAKNPKGCETLAGADLYSYFNDVSEEGDQRILTLEKAPDAADLNGELIEAIRCTKVIDQIEEVLGDCRPPNW